MSKLKLQDSLYQAFISCFTILDKYLDYHHFHFIISYSHLLMLLAEEFQVLSSDIEKLKPFITEGSLKALTTVPMEFIECTIKIANLEALL